ncbi:MAG: hypothetical protein AAB439_02725 [Patescibacteria group bacterium]
MKKFFNYISYLAVFALVSIPRVSYAATCGEGSGGLQNPLQFCTLTDFLSALLGAVIQIAFPIIVLFIVFIGFRFVQESAAGNAEKMKELRGLLFWAIVGALLILGAQVLSYAIDATVQQLGSGIR